MKRLFIAIALGLMVSATAAFSGCSTMNQTQKIEAACASATSSIQIATLYKDQLSAEQVRHVEAAIEVVQPVCGNRDTVPTLDAVKQVAFDAAIKELSKLAAEVQQ